MKDQELFRPFRELEPERRASLLESYATIPSKETEPAPRKKKTLAPLPVVVFSFVMLLLLQAGVLYPSDPGYMALTKKNLAPSAGHLFGTDPLGRDVFGMVLHGGRISMAVGLLATLVSTGTAVLLGTLGALLPKSLANLINRFMDLCLSIPSILLMIFLQALWGGNTLLSISVSIGLSGWMTMAKMVSIQIQRIRGEEYVQLARYQGAGSVYLLRRHFLPELLPVVVHMSFSGFAHAMAAETTLSFLGIGFPVGTVTWGTLLSLSGQALLSKSWWIILIPGVFLVTTVVALVEIGDGIRKRNSIAKNL